VETDISEKTNGSGTAQPLAEPLMQSLTFAKIAKGETELKANKLRAFLLNNGFDENESVGEFTADLNGHLSVLAPIMSYGLTEKFTLALAVPVYKAATSIEVGFKANDRAQAFLNSLSNERNNLSVDAREAAYKLNNAVDRLDEKLVDNGYRELDDWKAQGLGDITLAGKYKFFENPRLAMAATGGIVAPTGRGDDPDILNDIAFGDGQWDLFSQLSFDQPIPGAPTFTLNENAKYTLQLPGRKVIRDVEADEQIEVGKSEVAFKLGDKVDMGVSLQWQPRFGLIAGVGYTYFKKFGDVYRDISAKTKLEMEDGTDQNAHNGEAVLGYSTIPAFQRQAFSVPVELKLSYLKQYASRNLPVSDLAQLDFSLFF
jgi:hypothetical protein